MSEQKRRATQRAHHFVYKTECTVTGKYYIGMHSTDDLEDGYLGSGWRLRSSVKKYGAAAHTRTILEYLPDRKSLALREKQIVNRELLQDPLCLNLCEGGQGNYLDRPTEQSTREKITKANLKRWATEKQRRAVINADAPFSLTREEILAELMLPNGQLNKNASRNLFYRDIPSRSREAAKARKWNYILEIIKNPIFGDNLVELINAYVFQLSVLPTCKRCEKSVSFFRFGQPYATFCSPRCAMTGNSNAKRAINTARFLGE